MTEKIKTLLGLMKKASCLVRGEDNCIEAISKGKVRLLLLASDAGEKLYARSERYLEGHSAMKLELPLNKLEFGAALGSGSCSMAAVTDIGFSDSLLKLLVQYDEDKYFSAAAEIRQKKERLMRRKRLSPASEQKRKI